MIASIDAVNTIATIYAFAGPLYQIIHSLRKTYKRNFDDEKLKYPVIKISILTIFASSTSVITCIISGLTETNLAFCIDIPINSLCIMLMTNYYSGLYQKLCCGCIKCISLFDNKQKMEHNLQNQIDECANGEAVDVDDTQHDTRTLGIIPDQIKLEKTEYTVTIQN